MSAVLEAKTRLRQLAQEAQRIYKDPSMPIEKKSLKISQLEVEADQLGKTIELGKKSSLLAAGGSSINSREGAQVAVKGTIPAPSITPTQDQLHELHEAVLSHKSIRIEVATKGVGDLVPDMLVPGVVALANEPTRLLEHLPVSATDVPVVEYIQHQSTTGAAGMTAAGTPKPAVTFVTEKLEARARKIAAVATLNDEDLADFTAFASYVQAELTRMVIDVENAQIIAGDGTGENLLGLLNQTGILTRALGTDTPLDTMEEALTDLRVGPAFCPADLIVLNPSTFSKLRRSKDTQERYLLNADPSAAEASSLWGIPVLQTTQIVAGTGLVLNTQQAAAVWVRQGIVIQADYGQTGFENNQTSFRCEERLALASPRPAAALKVTGL